MFSKIKEMDNITKMAIVGGISIVLIVIGVIAAVSALRNNEDQPKKTVASEVEEKILEAQEEDKEKSFVRMLGLVESIDTTNQKIATYEFENGKATVLKIDGTVTLKDEYGMQISLQQLSIGDIIECKYDKESLMPEDGIQISARAWERKNLMNISVDYENSTIRIGSDHYIFDESLMVIKKGESITLEDIHEKDELVVKGYKDAVLVVEVVKGHGTIKLENHQQYVDGIIEVDKKTYDITDITLIDVASGVQNIIISKENLTEIVRKVMINEDAELVIDLGDVVPDKSIVNFVINEEDTKLYIEGELQENYKEPITLEFGEYAIRAEKDGFSIWEGKLLASSAYMTYPIDLTKRQIMVNIGDPVGFSVFIGTNYVGEIPIKTSVSEGDHTITIRKDGYYSKMYNILIENTGKDYNFTFPELVKIEETTVRTSVVKPEETTVPASTTEGENEGEGKDINDVTTDVYIAPY